MILCIAEVLDAADLARVRQLLEGAQFVDGRATSRYAARLVKNNLQLAPTSANYAEVTELIATKVRTHSTFRMAALPRKVRPPLIARSEPGMGYGRHVDDAIMGTPPARADLSYTLFLSAPTDYEGGELVIEDTLGEHSFKLDAGALVVYPASRLHRVETVRSGLRVVAAGWVQSLCRDPGHRETLFDLQRVLREEFDRRGKTEQFDLLSKSYSNLLRLFAEP